MTKLQLVQRVGRRLGDSSASMEVILLELFDNVLRDLSAAEVLEPQVLKADFSVVEDGRFYSASNIASLTLPDQPVRVLSVYVPEWGTRAIVEKAESDRQFENMRFGSNDTMRGKWQIWRGYSNDNTIEVWPPASGEEAGDEAVMVYLAPALSLASGAEITYVKSDDLPTVEWGLLMYAAPFLDEALAEVQMATEHFEQGKARMYARRHNSGPKRISVDPAEW